jgi:hypothetical protein
MPFLKLSGLRAPGMAAAAAVALAACSGGGGSSNYSLPLIRASLSIKNVSQGGRCDGIRVRMTPKELIGPANKYEGGAPMCNGTGQTLPMAPGNWEFSAPLASGSAQCQRHIKADGDLMIQFIDGIDGCSGPPPEAAAPETGTEVPAAVEEPAAG